MAKTIVITGASDGIGAAAARELHRLGHTVVLIGRTRDKTRAVADELRTDHFCCDFTSLDEVRGLASTLAQRYPVIDVLVNNAGGIMGDRRTTADGHEVTWQVNHLAPFLLTTTLLPRLIESRATVIATSSSVNKMAKLNLDDLDSELKYSAARAYANAKLANVLFTRELHKRYATEGISAVSFQPGPVATNFAAAAKGTTRLLYHSLLNSLLLTPGKGADTLVWLANTKPGIDWAPGDHYAKRTTISAHRVADDDVLRAQVWERTEDMVRTHRSQPVREGNT